MKITGLHKCIIFNWNSESYFDESDIFYFNYAIW